MNYMKMEAELKVPGWFSAYDMEYIYPALKQGKKDDVYLEIGVDRGRSLTFARKYFKGDVFGIDIETIEERGGDEIPKRTNFIHGDSLEVKWTLPIKILFIDGEHRYDRVKGEYKKYGKHVVKGGWIFFHDADDTSPDVEKFAREKGATFSKNPRCSMASIRV